MNLRSHPTLNSSVSQLQQCRCLKPVKTSQCGVPIADGSGYGVVHSVNPSKTSQGASVPPFRYVGVKAFGGLNLAE